MTQQPRHSWGEPNRPNRFKTERECLNGCGIIKVSRHENNRHWQEFWRVGDVEKIDVTGTPPCLPVATTTSSACPAGGLPDHTGGKRQ